MKAVMGTISGRVQGVGFRFFTRETAKYYGLKGWVKNLYNGDVEYFVQGNKESVQAFLNKIQKGPSFSYVQNITKIDTSADNQLNNFYIKH